MADFIFMNGHGVYVWTGYAVSIVVLGAFVVARLSSLRGARRFRRDKSQKS